ncbi:MAG: tripartite tricarboxylate transporter permease [Methyloligellaceae bacterium]
METLDLLFTGFSNSLTSFNLVIMILGVSLGLIIGALPGLGSVNGVAILLPLTFLVTPTSAIILLGAIYYGAMYGGAVSSILLGIPGASTAVATTFDGRPMALNGQAGKALILAAVASFIGGTVSVVLFTFFAPPLAELAIVFGSAEEFALVVLAFTTFFGLSSDDIWKTLVMIALGLVLSSVGLDIISGKPRLIFGDIPGFYHGIHFVVLAIGVYGIGEMLVTMEESHGKISLSSATISFRDIFVGILDTLKRGVSLVVGTLLGFFVGMLPAAGATPAALMSYGVMRNLSKEKDQFGKGAADGVIAPEAANNAASTGAFLPMITLGIPGSPTTALLLGGMVIWGLQPGPLLFVENPEFVWGLISSLYLANIAAVILMILGIPVFVAALRMPFTILAPIVFALCIVGGFAPTLDLHDVWLIMIFGLGAFVLRKLDYPLAPLVLALVLGPLLEKSFRQSVIASQGSVDIFFERPIAASLLAVAAVLILIPVIRTLKRRLLS